MKHRNMLSSLQSVLRTIYRKMPSNDRTTVPFYIMVEDIEEAPRKKCCATSPACPDDDKTLTCTTKFVVVGLLVVALLVLAIPLLQLLKDPKCDEGWTPYDRKCYKSLHVTHEVCQRMCAAYDAFPVYVPFVMKKVTETSDDVDQEYWTDMCLKNGLCYTTIPVNGTKALRRQDEQHYVLCSKKP